jgi:hypothetical protein
MIVRLLGTLRDQYILSTANKKAELMVASRQLKETPCHTVDNQPPLLARQNQ